MLSAAAGGCDAPACAEPTVALIRGVGLCEDHLRSIDDTAAKQGIDAASLSRPVILALLAAQQDGSAAPASRLREAPRVGSPAAVGPGFYWVQIEGEWTVVKVARDGTFTRLGHEGADRLADHEFGRMIRLSAPLRHLPPR